MALLTSHNPTKLRIGTTGTLEGRVCTVVGRVVLTTSDGYRWHEYNLRSSKDETLTLVYEDGEWKLFRLFEPAALLSATEAARVRADQGITLDGRSFDVTYVGNSRVVYIEGVAPEGVQLGDQAHYFNAEGAGRQVVVSWTGDEVEFFEGRNLNGRAVATAFGLPAPGPLVRAVHAFRASSFDPNYLVGGGILVVLVIFVAAMIGDNRDPVFPEPPAKRVAPAAVLPTQAVGRLGSHRYTVAAHAVVEFARPGKIFARHEYFLKDESGGTAVLVQGPDGNPALWHMLVPAVIPANLTPYEAARVPMGRTMLIAGTQADAVLFRLKVDKIEGEPAAWPGPVEYGFVAQGAEHWVQARWTEAALQYFVVERLAAQDIATAFHAPQVASY